MRKYKKLTHINRLQQKMDQKYGKGKFHAVFVLGLFFCLFFTSCANEPGSSRGGATTVGNTPPVGSAEGTTHTGQNAGARITVTNSGQTVTINNPFGEFPAVLDAYFARQDTESGEYKKIKSAAIGDTVYIVVDTVNLNARKITVTIKDKNNIISGDIPFQQYKQNGEEFSTTPEDVGGKFEAKVRNEIKDQRFALYKIALKGKDEDTTKEWKEDIQGHTGKKLQLSLVVNADEENVVYCGSNSSDESQRSSDTENNVWLNQDGKWFEVNPKKPDIIYHIYYSNGEIHYELNTNVNERKNAQYYYHDSLGNIHDLGLLSISRVTNIYPGQANYLDRLGGNQIFLVDVRHINNYVNGDVRFSLDTNTNRYYLNDITTAALLGAMLDCGYTDFVFNGCSNHEGRSIGGSNSHKNGVNADMRYLRTDQSGLRVYLDLTSTTGDPCGWRGMDEERQNAFNDALYKYGWKSFLSWRFDGRTLNHSTHYTNHNNHLHMQGFAPILRVINT